MEQIHVLVWNTIDSWKDNRGFIVEAFGRLISEDKRTHGRAIHLQLEGYQPSIRLKISKNTTRNEVEEFFIKLLKVVRGIEGKFTFESKFALYPYTETHDRFVKLTFNGEFSRKKAADLIRQWIKEKNYSVLLPCMQLYDAALPSLLAMQHELDIAPTGHIGIDTSRIVVDANNAWRISYKNVVRINDDRIAPFKIASFDIETLSYESYCTKGSIFPDHKKEKDTVSQIGTVITTLGNENTERYVFVLDSDKTMFNETERTLKIEDTNGDFILYAFYTEAEMLIAWSRFIKKIDPDIFIGYNIFGFDWNYIHERCLRHGIDEEFCRNLSRTDRYEWMFQSRQLCSNGYGDNRMTFYDPVGRHNLDVYLHVKKEFKLDSYKLDNVASHFLQLHKNDMSPESLFQALKESKESCIEAAKYCVQDCNLVSDLMVYLKIFPSVMEMSNISRIPFQFVLLRGQQIRCFSLISFHANIQRYSIPDKIDVLNKSDNFEGGFVMSPEKKVYMEDPICVLDVMSLYPSLIIAYNLCYTTVVISEETKFNEDDITSVHINADKVDRFVKTNKRTGLLSIILQDLWIKRQNIKAQMKTCEKHVYALLDARQLSVKLCMNSIFGLAGNGQEYAMLPCQYIAESITCMGRQTIQFSRQKIEEWYGKDIVKYIDSDSLFICFGGETKNNLQRAFEMGFEAEHRINEILPAPIKMEFEKILFPFIILTKKRYCGLVYEDQHDLTKSKILYKGISVVRRDFCQYTKQTLEESLSIVFMERNIQKAYDHVQDCVKALLENRVDNKQLIMSKTLTSKNTSTTNNDTNTTLAHVALYRKMKAQDPNNCPNSGDRIEFLFIITGGKLLRDRVEHPDIVNRDCLPIDFLYYFNNQLRNPIEELFTLLVAPEPFDLLGKSKSAVTLLRMAHDRETSIHNKRNGQPEITSFFSKRVRENMLEEKKQSNGTTESSSMVLRNMPSMKFGREI